MTRNPKPETRNAKAGLLKRLGVMGCLRCGSSICDYQQVTSPLISTRCRWESCADGAARPPDVRLPGKGDSNSHGARPVHQIIPVIKWIWTSRLSVKISLSRLTRQTIHWLVLSRVACLADKDAGSNPVYMYLIFFPVRLAVVSLYTQSTRPPCDGCQQRLCFV